MKFKLLIVVSIFLFTSCIIKKENESIGKDVNKVIRVSNNSIYLPDTLSVNEIYKNELIYSSELDTINLSEKDHRFIILYLTTEDGTFNEVEVIEKVKHKAFTTGENDDVIQFEFSFDKLGMNPLNMLIEDMVILDSYYGDKSRIITYLTTIKKEIFVFEDSNDSSYVFNSNE